MEFAMGFDVFLCKIRSDGTSFDRQIARDIIAKHTLEPKYVDSVGYPEDGGDGEIFGIDDDDKEFNSLMFAHFGGRAFLSLMFELTDRLEGLLVWPGDSESGVHMGVTKEALLPHVPNDLKNLGEAAIIRDVDHLGYLIGNDKMTPMTYIKCG
jgi:hypothetical protein